MYPILIVPDRIRLAEKSSLPPSSDSHQIDLATPVHGINEHLRTIEVWREWCGIDRGDHVCRLNYPPLIQETNKHQTDCGPPSLADCEMMLKVYARRWRARMCRTQLSRAVALTRSDMPSDLSIISKERIGPDAAAWLLWSMYWFGSRRIGLLNRERLHPPTGLIRWVIGIPKPSHRIGTATSMLRLQYQALAKTEQIWAGVADRMYRRGAYLFDAAVAPIRFTYANNAENVSD